MEKKLNYPYFNDKSDEIAFYVLEMKGALRVDRLHITAFCYHNKAYAKKWRDSLIDKLDPNKPYYEEVCSVINEVYDGMKETGK